MSKFARRLTTAIAVAALAATVSAAAAGATVPGHFTGTFSFPANWCGFDGIDTVTVLDNFGSQMDGTTWDAGRLVETFVADNGRGVSITYDAGREENAVPVVNPDGTTTLVFLYSGLNAKTQAVGGPVLQQNAGRVQVTVVLDPDGNVLSITVVALAGPNPNLTGAPDCSVVGPYLAGA
jgi:hypothetical protein